MPKKKN